MIPPEASLLRLYINGNDRWHGQPLYQAVVETAPGQTDLTFAEMVAWCKEAGLMTQKIPEQLEVLDALPYNSTGKVLKADLRKRYT